MTDSLGAEDEKERLYIILSTSVTGNLEKTIEKERKN